MKKLEVKPKYNVRLNLLIDKDTRDAGQELADKYNMSFSDLVRYGIGQLLIAEKRRK